MDDLRNFINGQWTDMSYDAKAELIDPSTGEAFATAPVSGDEEVDAAFAAASEAFGGWRDATPSLLWTDGPGGRLVITLGHPTPGALSYLCNPRHRASKFWPLGTTVLAVQQGSTWSWSSPLT